MFTFSIVLILALAGFIGVAVGNIETQPAKESAVYGKTAAEHFNFRPIGFGLLATALILMVFTSITRVPDGHVSGVSTFGVYGDDTLKPGLNLIAPWQSTTEIDGRLQCRKFGDPSQTEPEPFSTAVSAQAEGGGNLVIDMSVCTQADPEKAVKLLKEVGPQFSSVLLTTSPRSCLRNSVSEYTVDEAIGDKRVQLGIDTTACINEFTADRGLNVIEVQISDVDPGAAVRQSNDDKEQAKQRLQLAATQLEQARIEAQREAAIALGISNAEQIVACGGVETTDAEGGTVIVPNEECEDQFSIEYLQWLYINQLSEIDGVVLLPSELDQNLFVTVPAPAQTTSAPRASE